jgi:TolB-like protein/AraC-like DNA-binding protein
MVNQPSMSDQFREKVFKCIEDNLDNEHFSVEDLAMAAGISRSMLHRRLIRLTGKSASDLIMERRLIRAKELLENNVATAAEIAYRVGFNSPSYFNKVFKDYYQLSPGEVRKGTASAEHPTPIAQTSELHGSPDNSLKRLSLIVLIILLVTAVTGAGIYYLLRKGKPIDKSIAILPFDNLSANDENQYFADGIVEDLLNRLSKIDGLKVISRTSSEIFRNKGNNTIPQIAGILGVSYILEGTVQRESSNVRINIQLIDAKNDNHILSKQYDRKLSEIFKLQSEIAEQIALELSLVLTDQQEYALKQDQTTNLKAFEYKQLGRYHLNRRTREDTRVSVKYFRLAIREDPDYALAYAELADAYWVMPWYGYIDLKAGRDSAYYLSKQALKLDKNLGEAHNVLGGVYNEYDWDQRASEKEFLKAIECKPNHAPTYQYYSEFLCTMGKLPEAREILNKAILLDPYSYVIRYASSILYFKQGNLEQALAENQISSELVNEHSWAAYVAFRIYRKLNDEQSAMESFKKMVRITDHWTPANVDSVYSISGMNGLIRWRLKEGTFPRKNNRALYHAMLGEYKEALDILESSVDEGLLEPFVTTEPEFEPIRSNPRFIAIRKKMGLPPQ